MILGIYGAGGAGKDTKELAELLGLWEEIVFIDDTTSADIFKGIKRMPFIEFQEKYDKNDVEIIMAIGEPKYKISLYNKIKHLGYNFANVIHPNAIISPSAILGKGITVKTGAFIGADVSIEDNVRIEAYGIVGHDSIIHAHVQISASAIVSGNCEIGEGSYIGINVPIRDHIKIGKNSVISMGAVVQTDIPDFVTAMGNPARVMLTRTENDLIFQK